MGRVPNSQTTTLTTDTIPSSVPEGVAKLDIEHALVEDDPRQWSNIRKTVILLTISGASMIAGLACNIQNPANDEIQQDLHATVSQISLTLSLFILIQGTFPLIWSAVSEIKGRKIVYLLSVALFTVGSAIVAIATNIGLVIGMRILQAAGSSAVLAIGAATLADIYEPHQRGSMMGIYYSAPLLGPAIGPLLGGALTQGFDWRAVFWFLVIWGGVMLFAFLCLFKDTFRKERSLMYQNVVKRHMQERKVAQAKGVSRECPTGEKMSGTDTPGTQIQGDLEAQHAAPLGLDVPEVKLSIADVNPFPPYLRILRCKSNLAVLIPSGLLSAFSQSITYTCARTLALHYNLDAMKTGAVLIAFGIGSILGSVLGGRWSDWTLARLKAANNGVSHAEMRLESTKIAMLWFPPAIVGYAWVCQEHVHVAAVCVMLFLCGFFSIWIYASTLTYIVDANVGQSSSAVATNSSFRGISSFIALEVAVPLQDAIGDGGLYTLWAGLMLLGQLMILLALYKGKNWREGNGEKEKCSTELDQEARS